MPAQSDIVCGETFALIAGGRRPTNTVNWSDSILLAQGIRFGE